MHYSWAQLGTLLCPRLYLHHDKQPCKEEESGPLNLVHHLLQVLDARQDDQCHCSKYGNPSWKQIDMIYYYLLNGRSWYEHGHIPRPRKFGMTPDRKNRTITTATTIKDLTSKILSVMQYVCSSSYKVVCNFNFLSCTLWGGWDKNITADNLICPFLPCRYHKLTKYCKMTRTHACIRVCALFGCVRWYQTMGAIIEQSFKS